jgi:hypothetical protein
MLGFALHVAVGISAQIRELQPVKSFQVGSPKGESLQVKVQSMRASDKGIWFLIERPDPQSGDSILNLNLNGIARRPISLPAEMRAVGLTPTSAGVATVLVKKGRGVLTEYGADDAVVAEVALPCYGAESLLNMGGRAAAVCASGNITVYGPNASVSEYSSWVRPGAIATVLSNGVAAIVDRSTAGIVLNNLITGKLSVVPPGTPEIEEALRMTAETRRQAAKVLRPADPPLGRALVAMDVSSDNSGFYILLYPFHESLGPAVVKFSNEGQLLGRYRCKIPNSGSFVAIHQVAAQNGFLILGSRSGHVFVFKP